MSVLLQWVKAIDACHLLDGHRTVGEWYPGSRRLYLYIGRVDTEAEARRVLEHAAMAIREPHGSTSFALIQADVARLAEGANPAK